MDTLRQHSYSGALSAVESNKVLRNTYTLLAMTLTFSAVMAGISSSLNLPHPGILITLVGYFGLLFFTTKFRNSGLGLVGVFGLTGFMGYTLGPIINRYLALPNGGEIVMLAMAGTATIFFALSAYALVKKTNFSFMGSFLTVGVLVAFLGGLAAMFFQGTCIKSGGVCHVCLTDVWHDFVADQRNSAWRRDQLHHGDCQLICLYF